MLCWPSQSEFRGFLRTRSPRIATPLGRAIVGFFQLVEYPLWMMMPFMVGGRIGNGGRL